jgi:ribosomal protein S18 acetylase RimI-like enzyme
VKESRPFEPSDIPQVVALRRRVYTHSGQASDAALARYYQTLFFENPWHDDRHPCFVQEGSAGEILGFVGSIPRPMLFGSERLTAVIATELMVAPDARGFIGLKLLRRLLEGSQPLTFSDRGNDQARALYEGLGGSAALWYSLYWSAPLDGSQIRFDTALAASSRSVVSRALRRASRLLDRFSKGSIKRKPITTSDELLTAETAMSVMRRLAGKSTLVPEYDAHSFGWLMQRLAETRKSERVVSAQVLHDGEVIGFFVYVMRQDGEAEVVQLAALPRREDLTFGHLIHHAVGQGGTVLRGRFDRRLAALISQRELPLTLGQPWTLMRAGRPELAAQFLNGDAFLSRLDAEWWIGT